jgi:hypothetical protein
MVSTSAHHADAYPVALVPASISIDNIDAVPGVEVINRTLAVDSPDLELRVSESALEVAELHFGNAMNARGKHRAAFRCGAAEAQSATCKDVGSNRFSIGYVPSVT